MNAFVGGTITDYSGVIYWRRNQKRPMTRVTKAKISADVRDEAWRNFLLAVRKSGTPASIREAMAKFLTPAELVMLEKRLVIPVLVGRGMSYRQIGAALGVSANTVSFVKYHLVRNPLRAKIAAVRKEFGSH